MSDRRSVAGVVLLALLGLLVLTVVGVVLVRGALTRRASPSRAPAP